MEKKKKRVILFLIILCTIGVLSAVGMLLVDYFAEQKPGPSVYYYPEHMFETPDFNCNILEDTEYLETNRTVYYSSYGVTVPATDVGTEIANFWLAYFAAIQNGDAEAYNSFLADDYRNRVGKKEDFTMQRIYDIYVEYHSETYPEDGEVDRIWIFRVSYCIARNDGTFRRDILSDGAGPQYIGVAEKDGEFKIISMVRIY